MEIKSIEVPTGIKYISDWKEYSLENYQFPHILNKVLTGCGYTEYCIRNNMNIILCSPRKILLENKEDQHKGNVYYVRNEVERGINFEKDFSSSRPDLKSLGFKELSEEDKKLRIMKLKQGVVDYWNSCQPSPFQERKPCKILVTYDSFRHVKEALGERISDFYVVIDEFQSIFTDAKFKSSSELEFVGHLQGLNRVVYVSATPMIKEYLEMLNEFKDLPYFELDWNSKQPGRIMKPNLNVKYCGKRNTIQAEIAKVILKYTTGNYDTYRYKDEHGNFKEIESREAVFYVNSVKDIAKAIKLNKLTPNQCNILIAKTPTNETTIQRAFGLKKSNGPFIGKVPKKGEQHKTFTFCTRTVYLGADFYSTCAKSYIFSNANIDCLSVDISLDLPQILGRQRLDENPWKNSADLYVTLKYKGDKSKEEFKNYLEIKLRKTESLLKAYTLLPDEDKDALVEKYERDARNANYKTDFVAVNHHAGSMAIPAKNDLMMISEMRTFEIQEYDYKDRFAVFSNLSDFNVSTNKDKFDKILNDFNYKYKTFRDRMKFICNQKDILEESGFELLINSIPMEYKNYIITLGVERIKAGSYTKAKLEADYQKNIIEQSNKDNINSLIYSKFNIGDRISNISLKASIQDIYNQVGNSRTAKAEDINQWFEVKAIQYRENGKKVNGIKIINKK